VFTTDLQLLSIRGTSQFKLLTELRFAVEEKHVIVVPAGFVTDLISVPWYVRWLINPTGPGKEAAVVHDFLLSVKTPADYSRRIFIKALQESNVSSDTTRIMQVGVWLWDVKRKLS